MDAHARTVAAESPSAAKCGLLRGVHRRYGGTVALAGVDLSIAPGEVVALLGANGAGKSTAVALLCGLQRPDAGRALLFGRDPRDPAARAGLGVMLQTAAVPETLTVAELVRLQSGYFASPRPLPETLGLAGLVELADRRYGRLSGGQKRRLQFALAISGRPRLMLVDEPTAGLDCDARAAFWTVLRGMAGAGAGVLLTTHYLQEADALADRVVVLADGRVIGEGTADAVKRRVVGTRVLCRSSLRTERLAAWPEVIAVAGDGGRLALRTATPEALVRRLLEADPALSGLEVRAPGLDEALAAMRDEVTR